MVNVRLLLFPLTRKGRADTVFKFFMSLYLIITNIFNLVSQIGKRADVR